MIFKHVICVAGVINLAYSTVDKGVQRPYFPPTCSPLPSPLPFVMYPTMDNWNMCWQKTVLYMK